MHFSNIPYERISYEDIKNRYQQLQKAFQEAADDPARMEVLRQHYQLLADMTSMEICYVRHDMNVNDAFYAAEQDYYDEIGPLLADLSNKFDKTLLDSPHRLWLENVIGRQAVTIMEQRQQGFDSSVIALAQEENNLLSRHNQLAANGSAVWEGRPMKRSLMDPLAQSDDRATRQKASLAISKSWEAQREELENIYDELVKNRHQQAVQLGFADYTALSYCRMNRIGYTPEDVQNFREQVKKELVPFLGRLMENRRKRLGLEHLYFYDERVAFINGNPTPTGDTAACLKATREMYTRLSPETAEFIAFLLDNGLYDVEIRDGKRDGGYMTTFEKYRAPFIFANFDGTRENAYIMCHEGGHAFQGYLKRNEDIREKCWLTSEAAETHAMAMEFFTWPYMELFFGGRAGDYRTIHLEDALTLIANQCLQDEFQQCVYEQPEMSPQARNELWLKLEQAYFPFRDYSGDANLLQGCRWQRIPHMFQWPFYAIDYALAQICALEYYRWMSEDFKGAWQSYLTFCQETGTKSFPELVRSAGLDNPFEMGTLKSLTEWLDAHSL